AWFKSGSATRSSGTQPSPSTYSGLAGLNPALAPIQPSGTQPSPSTYLGLAGLPNPRT
ncbi:hypothetical protein P175DRAFT_0553805, partial [Aspergillus ochraceoroseus IBT 24754]